MNRNKMYLVAALVFTLAYMVYFTAFLINAYNTFHDISDLGIAYSNNFYFNLHYPQIANGLQQMVFGNHVSPFLYLMLPFYMIYESSLTLLFIQMITIAITGLLVFFVAKDLTKSSSLALAFCIAFLIFPGTLGSIVFDFHAEYAIMLFFILTFYFYMKEKFLSFIISVIFLVCVMETTPLLALFLGLGLIAYEIKYNRKGKALIQRERLKYLISIIVIAIAAQAFYHVVMAQLAQAYSTSQYAGLPGEQIASGGTGQFILPTLMQWISNPIAQASVTYNIYANGLQPYLIYALIMVLLGMGIALFALPDVTLIWILPWLAGVFVFAYPGFIVPESQYFTYVDGAVICASILGATLLLNKRGDIHFRRIIKRIVDEKEINKFLTFTTLGVSVLVSIAGPAAYLLIATPLSQYHLVNSSTFSELVLFQQTPAQKTAYAQLDWVINKIPKNASLIVNNYISPHVSNRKYLEDFQEHWYWEQPQYMLIDMNKNISISICALDNCTMINDMINGGNYTLYIQNGTAMLYRLKNIT